MKFLKHILYSIIAIILIDAAYADSTTVSLWHKVPGGSGKKLLFLAHEEDATMKGRVGQWLPEEIFDIAEKGFRWKIDKLERIENKVHINVSIQFASEKVYQYQISHFDEGPNGPLEGEVNEKEGESNVSIKLADGTTRDLLFATAGNLNDLKAKYTTSKAMPLWSWDKAKIVTVQ